jgi:hypothetical protein
LVFCFHLQSSIYPLSVQSCLWQKMSLNNSCYENIKGVTLKLLEYCRANDWAGYDPYDALNSKVFKGLPFLNFKLFRLALTQSFKRSPINLRPLFLVPKTKNPKALALFLMALVKFEKIGLLKDKDLIDQLVDRLEALRSPDSPYWCWGYSFPWQTRTILVPQGSANIVCTTFVANALLDVYEKRGDSKYLQMAISAAEYIVSDLFWEKDQSVAGFSYPLPGLQTPVHNANFLGAALLCRVSKLTGDRQILDKAFKAARYSASRQREDGSWDYGEAGTQAWVDNFHTGYNLCALKDIGLFGETEEFEPQVQKGFDFYRKNFFREDGAPKYYQNSIFPLDIHSVAQSIITILRFKNLTEDCLTTALLVYKWALANLWDDQGYFYYQERPFYKNKISYMRWAQAWMLLALCSLLKEVGKEGPAINNPASPIGEHSPAGERGQVNRPT